MEGPPVSVFEISSMTGSELHSSPISFKYYGSKSIKKFEPVLSLRKTILMLEKQMRFAKKPRMALRRLLNTLSSG